MFDKLVFFTQILLFLLKITNILKISWFITLLPIICYIMMWLIIGFIILSILGIILVVDAIHEMIKSKSSK